MHKSVSRCYDLLLAAYNTLDFFFHDYPSLFHDVPECSTCFIIVLTPPASAIVLFLFIIHHFYSSMFYDVP